MSMFSSALASGQLGPLMNQFGLPAEAVDAANKGGQCLSTSGSDSFCFIAKKLPIFVFALEAITQWEDSVCLPLWESNLLKALGTCTSPSAKPFSWNGFCKKKNKGTEWSSLLTLCKIQRKWAEAFHFINFMSYFPLTADVEAFAKAMETETKSDHEGDSKDKKDDDEDMSLDWEHVTLLSNLFIKLFLFCNIKYKDCS